MTADPITLHRSRFLHAAPSPEGGHKFMANDVERIVNAIAGFKDSLEGRIDDVVNRLDKVEITLEKTREEQAVSRGQDVNVRLHDHEIRLRKLEQFKFWLLGGVACGSVLGSFVASHFFK